MNSENIIYEYSRVKSDTLSQHIKKNEVLHKYFKEEWGIIKAKQYCGILNFKGEDFYILPKISDSNVNKNLNVFIYMLRYAYNIKLENENTASLKNEKYNAPKI